MNKNLPNKILVVNVNWVGDVIFSTPVFKALRKKYPQARISCLAVPRVKAVLEASPCLDEIIVYDERGRHWNPLGKLRLVLQLRQGHFDIAFLLHRSWTRAVLVFLAGISERVGYDTKKRGCLLTHKAGLLEGDVHRRDHYLNVIESYGVAVEDRACELTVLPQDRSRMEETLRHQGVTREDCLIVVNVGGNWDLKRWPEKNFGLLMHRLVTELHVKVIIPGAAKDVALAKRIAACSTVNPVVLAGKTDLKQLMALMQRADLVISSDSGPLHMASGVGSMTIGLFGPTRPEITGPQGRGKTRILQKNMDCNRDPCYRLDCPDNVCMQAVTVDDVMEAAGKCLRSGLGDSVPAKVTSSTNPKSRQGETI